MKPARKNEMLAEKLPKIDGPLTVPRKHDDGNDFPARRHCSTVGKLPKIAIGQHLPYIRWLATISAAPGDTVALTWLYQSNGASVGTADAISISAVGVRNVHRTSGHTIKSTTSSRTVNSGGSERLTSSRDDTDMLAM
jgi:hypothetical protein